MSNIAMTGERIERARRAPTLSREDWNRRYEATDLIWSTAPTPFLAAQAPTLAPGRALDLAAGEGRNAVWLAERGWNVTAVDFAEVAIEKAREVAAMRGVAGNIAFDVADLTTYQPQDRGFDLVAMMYFHIPWPEVAPVIARAAEAVAPGGTFLLAAHDATNLEKGFGGPQRADMLYTAEQVVEALGGRLDIEMATCMERPVKREDETRIALDCVVRARRAG